MNFKFRIYITLLTMGLLLFSCGSESGNKICISGKLNINSENRAITKNRSTFVVVSKTMNYDDIQNDPINNIIELALVESYPYEFTIDLSKGDVSEGDIVYIIAFTTDKYVSGVPSISTGDMVGLYVNRDNFEPGYTIKKRDNTNIEVDVNREVFDFKTSVSGTVNTESTGKITVVAYAGCISSFDFNDIDINAVIGYKKTDWTSTSTPFTVDILPYGYNIPIDNVYIFAFQDNNGNGKPDSGDIWGILSDEDGYPAGITVTDIPSANISLTLDHKVTAPTGYKNSISGSFEAPSGYGPGSSSVYMLVCKADDTDELFENTVDTVKYFKKIPSGNTTFDLELSGSGLKAGDKVMIIAMWDKDYTSDFPRLKEGNMIGYYIDEKDYTYQYVLNEGTNPPVSINLNKTYRKNSSVVTGNLLGTESGEVIIIAYTGEFDSLNAPIDTDKIIGYRKMTKGNFPASYSMDILPFYEFPVENVYLFAILDNNQNGIPDTGDRLGYFSADAATGVPTTLTLHNTKNSIYNIKFRMDYVKAVTNGASLVLNGSFQAPAGYTTDAATKPVFIMVARADNTDDIFNNPMSSMKYFTKLQQGATAFSIELAGTGLKAGDPVMVIALWDRDYTSGFPSPTDRDMIGYYINQSDYTCQYILLEGTNPAISLNIDKTYKRNNASANGTLLGTESGDVIIVAYTGEFNSLNDPIDTGKIAGYKKVTKGTEPLSYSIEILPINSFPVQNAFIFAVLDKNNNGKPDKGDRLGFYSKNQSGIPTTVNLQNTAVNGLDINFTTDYTGSVTGGTSIILNGSITAPSGYTTDISSKPVFILVTKSESTDNIISESISSLKYFVKLPQGSTTFSFELASTGLLSGEKVMIFALWDRDYVAGFPCPTDGDIIGYYINQADYTNQYTLAEGINTPLSIDINKVYIPTSATVSGNLLGNESGDVILIAYHGEINSLDVNLDMEKIVGYKKVIKGSGPMAYSMSILPVTVFPAENTFIFAIIDNNKNGIPDSGDRLGFYSSDGQSGVPSSVTLYDAANEGKDIQFVMNYPVPSTGGPVITLSGSITAPSGYSANELTKPVYIIIAKADNTFELIGNPMSSMKYFVKLPQGTTYYNINLTGFGLNPGDEIRILALWDKNYTGGFPNPDNGDKIGYYQNKTSFNFSLILAEGANYANLTNGWSFGIDKTIFKNNARFTFNFDQSHSGDLAAGNITGKDLIVVMVHQDGVKTSDLSYSITDMNYILSIDYIKAIPNLTDSHTLNMFPFIYDKITRTATSTSISVGGVYLYVIVDANSNGVPDSGEYLGYYWTWYLYTTKVPMKYSTIYYDRINNLNELGEIVSIFSNRTF